MAKSRIAEAYVQLVPTATGFKEAISREIDDPIDNSVKTAGSKFKALGGILAGALAGAAVVGFGKDVITQASDLNESLNAVKVTYGDATQGIVDLGKSAALGLGLSQNEFNALSVRFSAFAKTIAGEGGNVVGVVDELSKRGADFASVMNLDVNDALSKFQSGLAGETEPLRQFGIDLSAAAVEQYALANGIWDGTGQMTEAQKVQARYGSLMAQTSQVTGDFANTSDGLANSQRIASARFKDAQAALGEGLLPIVQNVVATFADLFIPAIYAVRDGFDWMGKNLNIVIPIIAGIATVILVALAPAIWAAVTATWAFTTALLANPLTWIALAIGALIAGIVFLIMNFDAVVKFLGDIFNPMIQAVGDFFTSLWENHIKPVVDAIGAIFTWVYETILRPIFLAVMLYVGLWAALFEWLYEYALKPVFEAIGKLFTWIYENIIDPFVTAVGEVLGQLGDFFTWLYENAVQPAFDGVAAAFEWLWKYGIKPVVDFISDAVENIGNVVETVFGAIGGFFKSTFDGLINIIRGPVNAVIGFINTLIGGLNKIKIDIPDWVPEWGGKTIGFNIAKIPMLAEGGTLASSGSVMVGEAGPEILTLPRGAQVTPLDKASAGTIIYNAAPNVSLDSEQALFTAMRRAKVVAGW